MDMKKKGMKIKMKDMKKKGAKRTSVKQPAPRKCVSVCIYSRMSHRLGPWFDTFISRPPAVRERLDDIAAGYEAGPIIKVDIPLPSRKPYSRSRSPRLRFCVSSSKALDVMIRPAVQIPHCTAP